MEAWGLAAVAGLDAAACGESGSAWAAARAVACLGTWFRAAVAAAAAAGAADACAAMPAPLMRRCNAAAGTVDMGMVPMGVDTAGMEAMGVEYAVPCEAATMPGAGAAAGAAGKACGARATPCMAATAGLEDATGWVPEGNAVACTDDLAVSSAFSGVLTAERTAGSSAINCSKTRSSLCPRTLQHSTSAHFV